MWAALFLLCRLHSPLPEALRLDALGGQYLKQGRLAESEKSYLSAMAAARRSNDRRAQRRIAGNLATLYLETGQITRAEQWILPFTLDPERDLGSVVLLSDLGSVYAFRAQYQDAERQFRRVLEILEDKSEPASLRIRASTMSNLASLLAQTHRVRDGAAYVRQALQTLETIPDSGNPDSLVKTLINLALFTAQANQPKEAEALFRRAIGTAESAFGSGSRLFGEALDRYGKFLRLQRRNREAGPVEERSRRILSANQRENALGHSIEVNLLLRKK